MEGQAQHRQNVHDHVARLLFDSAGVARFVDSMAYGPRALGNRSTTYQTTDASVSDWLNDELQRTERMPFVPAILDDKTHAYEQLVVCRCQ